ncbi:hypothetical protein LINPERPRIM_LOCUS3943 [Linum perenne]
MIRDKGPDAPPIQACMSAFPAKKDTSAYWTLLVVGSRRSFSTFNRRKKEWKNYDFVSNSSEEENRVCVGIGYTDEKFLCLFENGDVLIYGIHGERRMLLAVPPLTPGQLYRCEDLLTVEADKSMVVSWSRDETLNGGDLFRLMGVESGITAAADKEEEWERRIVAVREKRRVIKSYRVKQFGVQVGVTMNCFLAVVVYFVLFFLYLDLVFEML